MKSDCAPLGGTDIDINVWTNPALSKEISQDFNNSSC